MYGPNIADPGVLYILIGQMMAASVIIMFLDEMIQKGWGLGSGISLFIMAGVAQQRSCGACSARCRPTTGSP